MTVLVGYTSTWRKLHLRFDGKKGNQVVVRHMYLNFGVAEEMIHYGLHHLRHDTEEGPFILPKALRRRKPVNTLQDLFRRKMLVVNEEKLGPVRRKFHCPQVEFDLYWSEVYKSGLYDLTPFGTSALQAVKEFFFDDPHGHGTLPVYSLDEIEVTDENRKLIFDTCDRWGFLAEFCGNTKKHVMITPFRSTWWLRQFHRFEDRLEKLIPTGPCIEP